MKINRHNYETFFLLYADNELSAEERMIVEEFVQDNPDLKPELESFIETILPSEDIAYPSTGALYKHEIIFDNLQEELLLHLDGELDETSKKVIEHSINTNGQVEKEWMLWQQTKLDSRDKIIFSDKQRLYRHEKRVFTGWPPLQFCLLACSLLYLLSPKINRWMTLITQLQKQVITVQWKKAVQVSQITILMKQQQ